MPAYNAMQVFQWPDGLFYFEQPWTLDDVTYLLTMRWNFRAGIYTMDVADASNELLVAGIPLRTGRKLLSHCPAKPLPQGALFVFDSTGKQSDPGRDSFATTHQLLYAYNEPTQ